MPSLTPSSTMEEIEAAYQANLMFEELGSQQMAIDFIQAAQFWLLRRPTQASSGNRSLTLNTAAVSDLLRRAKIFLNLAKRAGNGVKTIGDDQTFRTGY
jgi:hypothetical protein